jgi:hypothetical protein
VIPRVLGREFAAETPRLEIADDAADALLGDGFEELPYELVGSAAPALPILDGAAAASEARAEHLDAFSKCPAQRFDASRAHPSVSASRM